EPSSLYTRPETVISAAESVHTISPGSPLSASKDSPAIFPDSLAKRQELMDGPLVVTFTAPVTPTSALNITALKLRAGLALITSPSIVMADPSFISTKKSTFDIPTTVGIPVKDRPEPLRPRGTTYCQSVVAVP